MIDGPFKNIIPEKIKLPESNKDIKSIVNDIENLKSEIENDIAEIGGEEEFDRILYENRKLADKQKIFKENILKIIYALGSIAIGSAFGYKAVEQAEGADYLERLKSMVTVESTLALFALLTALMATFSIKESEDKSEYIDQV